MSKRLEILKGSLLKKQQAFDGKLSYHFATVAQANGQPLNDKRNGRATMNQWERQNDALRNLNKGIKITENAIDREESKLARIECANEYIPDEIKNLVAQGILTQWGKHPNTFFVSGVEKARIVWDEKKKVVAYRYIKEVLDSEQYRKFAQVYNSLSQLLNKGA